jgi:hypothetical protein
MPICEDLPGFFASQRVMLENRLLRGRIDKLEEQMEWLMLRHHEASSRRARGISYEIEES